MNAGENLSSAYTTPSAAILYGFGGDSAICRMPSVCGMKNSELGQKNPIVTSQTPLSEYEAGSCRRSVQVFPTVLPEQVRMVAGLMAPQVPVEFNFGKAPHVYVDTLAHHHPPKRAQSGGVAPAAARAAVLLTIAPYAEASDVGRIVQHRLYDGRRACHDSSHTGSVARQKAIGVHNNADAHSSAPVAPAVEVIAISQSHDVAEPQPVQA